MNRSSLTVKVARLVQRFPFSIFRFLEWPFLFFSQEKKYNFIILLAPPRSGSTLAYQLLCHAFESHYLSNFSHLFYKLPYLGGWFSGKSCNNYSSDFSSNQGFVRGVCGPAEGLHFWRYWIGCGLDESENKNDEENLLLQKRKSYIQSVIKTLGKPDKPVIAGYLGHLVCIDKIKLTFPSAIIVKLYRDPVENALSILESKRKIDSEWFSVVPEECDLEDINEYSQVASQVYWLNKKMDKLKGERVLSINYEKICEHPDKVINHVAEFCNSFNFKMQIKSNLPESFFRKQKVENKDVAFLTEEFKKLEDRFGCLENDSSWN